MFDAHARRMYELAQPTNLRKGVLWSPVNEKP